MCLVGFSYISTKNKNNKQTAYVDSNAYCTGSLCMQPMVTKEKQDLLAEYLRGQIEDHGISFMGDNMWEGMWSLNCSMALGFNIIPCSLVAIDKPGNNSLYIMVNNQKYNFTIYEIIDRVLFPIDEI